MQRRSFLAGATGTAVATVFAPTLAAAERQQDSSAGAALPRLTCTYTSTTARSRRFWSFPPSKA